MVLDTLSLTEIHTPTKMKNTDYRLNRGSLPTCKEVLTYLPRSPYQLVKRSIHLRSVHIYQLVHKSIHTCQEDHTYTCKEVLTIALVGSSRSSWGFLRSCLGVLLGGPHEPLGWVLKNLLGISQEPLKVDMRDLGPVSLCFIRKDIVLLAVR